MANILNRFLGSYIENFDPKQLNIGIWSGDVKLKNLQLKKESLDKLDLPLNAKFGHLGELTLQIPWSNLKGKPVRIIIDDVYLLVSPTLDEVYDAKEEQEKELRMKKEKLENLETLQAAQTQNQGVSTDIESSESFTESLITKIVDNLQITIKNIHVRYEDDSTLTEDPYSIGLTLNELSAISTDSEWVPSFIAITQQFARKLLTLKNLSCYMNTNSASIIEEEGASHDSILANFKATFTEESKNISQTQYLLKPVSGEGKITVHKAGSTEKYPHIKAELFFQEFGVELDSQQYRDLLWTASKFHWYLKTQKFRRLKPKVQVSEDPRAWFKYAAESIVNEIHEKNYKWSWAYFKERRDQRKAYVTLYKTKILNPSAFPEDEKNRLNDLEEKLPYEDIKFYRSLARTEIRKENRKIASTKSADTSQTGGWLSYIWGGSKQNEPEKGNTNSDDDPDKLDLQLSDDQRKALYEAIDYNENEDVKNAIDLPRDRITMDVQASLKRGGLCIKELNKSNLTEIVFEGCDVLFYQRPDSFLSKFKLHEFRIEDGTDTSLYRHIVSVKHFNSSHSSLHEESPTEEPFFQVSYEQNPLDESADSILLGKLKSMTIFYNPNFIERVVKFFTPPKMHDDTIGAIMNAAEATMEGITEQTRLGLQYALEEHKTINVKLDLQAPLIILPLDPSSMKSPVAILDAGHISVISDLVDKNKIEDIKSKENYSTQDWEELNMLMYDKFNLHLQDAQFFVGSNIKSTMLQLHSEDSDRSALILDKLNIKLLMGISILPEAYSLAKFKISGEVPKIHLSLNDYQYKTIMQLVDALIPDFSDLNADDTSIFNAYGNDDKIREIEDDASTKEKILKKDESTSKLPEALKQRIFEASLNVGQVCLQMSRCVDAVTLETESLVDLIGNSLDFSLFKTMNDMHIDMTLDDLNVLDHLEKSGIPEFEKMISSNSFQTRDSADKTNKLVFKLGYDRQQRIVQFNGKEIEVFDQDIDVDIATVKYVLSRKSCLSLLNFVLNTFTNPNAEATPADELIHNNKADDQAPQKINVDVNLDSIIIVLNEDGLKLVTLELSTANFKVFIVPEELEVSGVLGALTLHDEINHGSPRDSMLRNLINMEGNNLAEFKYKTFDAATNENHYDSLLEFSTGAITVNFAESSINRIFEYLNQFLQMKSVYDKAREAAMNQASQIDNSKVKFDIIVRAPTVVFPKPFNDMGTKFDYLTAQLGEFYASNTFESYGDAVMSIISAGIRNVSLLTRLNFPNDVEQMGEIVKDLDMSFKIEYLEEYVQRKPMFKIVGKTPEINLHLTELQLNYLYKLSESLGNVFTTSEMDGESLENVVEEAANANATLQADCSQNTSRMESGQIASTETNSLSDLYPDDAEKVDFSFDIPKLSLVTYNNTGGIENFDSKRFASFSLNRFSTDFHMKKDGNFDSNIKAKSFVVEDVRNDTNSKYTKIIPPIKGDNDQFVISASSEGPDTKRNITIVATVESPQTMVALDHAIVIQSFISKGLEEDKSILSYSPEDLYDDSDEGSSKKSATIENSGNEVKTSSTTIGFSVNVKEPSIMLLQDPTKEDTLAIVFKVEQLLIASQNVNSIAANNIGMFITRMNNFDDHQYRIIDDFSISFAHDSRGSNETTFLTNIQASIDPILMRVSVRDIRLALGILNKASALYAASQPDGSSKTEESEYNFSEDFKRRLSQYAPSILTEFSQKSKQRSIQDDEQVIVKGEEFCASIGGFRFVLIGDVHELPVVDLNVKPFEARAINWSTDLSAEAHIDHYVNVYNYSKSTWEPIMEPWSIAIYASKTTKPQSSIVIDVVSRLLAEVTLTSRSLALLSQVFNMIKQDDQVKEMGNDNPYIIVNETGYDIEVWADHDEEKEKVKISSNESIPWSFEDWRQIRENLDSDNSVGVLGVKLIGSPYEEVRQIPATSEGDDLFMLFPPVDHVHNRLSCEISLGSDNVKTIFLRSTVVLRNDTDGSIGVLVTSNGISKELVIESSTSKALPIDFVYSGKFKIRPILDDTAYDWSNEQVYWKDLLKTGIHLTCNSPVAEDDTSYYFQAEAEYDEDEPLAKIYPHMRLVISSPVEIENLLPFDLDYRLYDKNAKKDWNGNIPKGEISIVHVVNLKNLLLLSVEPKNCGLKKSEFGIINAPAGSDFKREDRLALVHVDGQVLHLKLHYPRKSANMASLRVSIYSPYVILNRTAQNIVINEKNNLTQSNGRATLKPVEPVLFSFDNDGDRKSRAMIKIAGSLWSSPLSFDALGQVTSVRTQLPNKQKEMNFGISIAEGEGKYNLSKVVTVAPRYIVQNGLDESIQLLENGTTKEIDLQPGELLPLYGLRPVEKKNFLVKFAHASKSWSSPFTLDDIGRVYLKVYKDNVGQILLQVNILIENATIFIQIESANNHWPFSIRNFSDSEFYIYQNNPNINENGEVVKKDIEFKPIYYKIPAKSVMPYAYDYPNAVIKELIIRANGRERAVNLQEIGNLKPFRLPPTDNSEQRIIDLNVVADGPTQSLIITNYDPSVSLYKLQGDKSTSSSSVQVNQNFEVAESDENYYTKIVAKFEGFGISLINTRLQELCYITLRGLELRYNESDLYQNLSLKLKWVQIDNQLYGGIFPIVLYPSVVPKSGKEMNNHPSFSASVCKVKDDSHGVLFLKYATMLLQEMTLEIDEDFLFALIDFAKLPGASWNKEQVDRLCDETLELPEPDSLSNSSDVYFEALHLQPIQTNLSFVRTERINAEDKSLNQNTLMFFFNVLTMAIGNINDAPIQLNALFLENLRVPIPILVESIQTHYGQSFFYQVHKILGSADFLGNPVGLFNHLASGVLDIFYEPYQGFIINDRPQELGIGIAKGGLSFLKKSIFGFSDSFAKVTGSLAKGLSVVTDKKFQERRRLNQRRNKPKHALYGVANGANSFYESVLSGFTGIATAPIEGANSEGAAGFFKGLGKGFVGLPTKTAIGLFDLASNVSEGIRNTTTVFDAEGLDKVRLPRHVPYNGIIKPYSQREAQGRFWLDSIDGGIFFNERYLAHLLLSGEERAVLVTFKMIILFEINTLKSKWIIEYGQIKSITVEPTGISIGLKRKAGPFLPIPDRANRSFLYRNISIAVEEFNKHCQVVL